MALALLYSRPRMFGRGYRGLQRGERLLLTVKLVAHCFPYLLLLVLSERLVLFEWFGLQRSEPLPFTLLQVQGDLFAIVCAAGVAGASICGAFPSAGSLALGVMMFCGIGSAVGVEIPSLGSADWMAWVTTWAIPCILSLRALRLLSFQDMELLYRK